jgi:hypothetical protein
MTDPKIIVKFSETLAQMVLTQPKDVTNADYREELVEHMRKAMLSLEKEDLVEILLYVFDDPTVFLDDVERLTLKLIKDGKNESKI